EPAPPGEPASRGEPTPPGACPAIVGRGSPVLYVATKWSVVVSRRALKNRPHPCVCRQRSACTPFMLDRIYKKSVHSCAETSAGFLARATCACPPWLNSNSGRLPQYGHSISS